MAKKEKEHYVDRSEFEAELKEYYESDIMTDELCLKLEKIAKGLSYSPSFINYCVDGETEALTKRGWLKYYDITKDDMILSCDPKDYRYKWSNILDIFINENYNDKMFWLTGKNFNAMVTPGHRYLVKNEGLKPIDLIRCKDYLILTGKPLISQTEFTDDFVELIGWAVTEGTYKKGKTKHSVTIFQKAGCKADEIKDCLERQNVHYKQYYWNKEKTMLGFYITGQIANDIIKHSPNRVLDYDFINRISYDQRILLIKTMVKGDGCFRNDDDDKTAWSYNQKCKKHIDSFVALCTLAGLTTSCKKISKIRGCTKEPYYIVNIFSQPKETQKGDGIDFHGGRSSAGGGQHLLYGNTKHGKPNIPTIKYSGVVWCPVTEYGTFVCRRNDYISVTGNSYREDFVSDAMIKMYVALRDKKFSFENGSSPFSYFTTIAYNEFISRIKKEKRQHEAVTNYKQRVYEEMMSDPNITGNGHIYVRPNHDDDSEDNEA